MTGMFSNEIFGVIAFSLVGIAFFLCIYWGSTKKEKVRKKKKLAEKKFIDKVIRDLPDLSLTDILPWVVSFAFFPFFHLYCYEHCTIETFYTLFATLVQIFGTLLGLILIAIVSYRK